MAHIEDTRTVATGTGSPTGRPLPPPPTASAEVSSLWAPSDGFSDEFEGRPYRSARRRAQFAMAALVVAAASRALAAASVLADYRLVDGLLRSPAVLDGASVDEHVQRAQLIEWLTLGSFGLAAVLFIAWMHAVYANLAALGARGMRFGRGWAVGGWFVPFLNFVRPKQIVDDTWRASDPLGAPGATWSSHAVPKVVHVWWGLCLVVAILPSIEVQVAVDGDPVGDHVELLLEALAHGLAVVAAVLAIIVVARTTDRQTTRAALFDEAPTPAGDLTTSRRWAVRGAVVLGIVGFLATTASISVDAPGPDIEGGDGVFVGELQVGDCWLEPAGLDESSDLLLTVDVVDCGTPHDYEVISARQHPLGDDDGPSIEATELAAIQACTDALFERLGPGAMSRGFDYFGIWPTPDTWAMGGRWLVCSAYRLDGGWLTAPLT